MSSNLRNTNLRKLRSQVFDVCIVGGGINGAVSAAALAAQGVSVALIDKGDFGGSTSSQSSNLAWGGIKYLETWNFRWCGDSAVAAITWRAAIRQR